MADFLEKRSAVQRRGSHKTGFVGSALDLVAADKKGGSCLRHKIASNLHVNFCQEHVENNLEAVWIRAAPFERWLWL